MPDDVTAGGDLPAGLYDLLVSRAVQHRLPQVDGPVSAQRQPVDPEDAHAALAQYLEHLLFRALATHRGRDHAERQQRLVERVLEALSAELGAEWIAGQALPDPLMRLLAVHSGPKPTAARRPGTPLARSALLTGTRADPALAHELAAEFANADRVDILCSFIKWSGLRLLLDSLVELTAKPHPDGPRLRVITTSYMGATDARAIERLAELPNTEVRVSYDTRRTRLHAKAYLVHRATGFGSGYVGSANMTGAALAEGLEWTTKVSEYELPYLWQKLTATFETYWNDDDFESFDAAAPARLRDAIRRERGRDEAGVGELATFDLRPYPFQEEILDELATQREVQDKHEHLVVAATGTGKTMLSAFDYRRWAGRERPSLLYVAHREEILKQALGTFRAVLHDQNFGELLVGNATPQQHDHLFCSIQSYNSRALWQAEASRYDYVVVDEFHHAAAPSYRRMLDHVQPRELLGLTATPERADGLDVLHWFGGAASVELRLPDAIGRRLLCPFQYFGVSDSVDLDNLRWQRGGYSVEDLDNLYTGNDIRARLVLDKVHQIVTSPTAARGLGFCVSIAHAQFMAKYFSEHGLPALAVWGDAPDEVRQAAPRRLVQGEVCFLFTVDLYNEGVDIPEVDTILLLRPTESLTVFLQQLGRGLRHHDDKECLTVLDFIGAQRREFRFAPRFRALTSGPTINVAREVEAGFPTLPAGCSILLERVAQQRVLDNIRQNLARRRAQLEADLRELGTALGRAPSLAEALEYLAVSLDDLLRRGSWSQLLATAGLAPAPHDPDGECLAKGVRRLAHLDAPQLLAALLGHLQGATAPPAADLLRGQVELLHTTVWGNDGAGLTLEEAEQRLAGNTGAVHDLKAVLGYCLAHTRVQRKPLLGAVAGPLELHASYSRDEILVGLGYWSLKHRPAFREGVLHVKKTKLDAFFITLHKTEAAYSPTTMYEDYAITDRLFHWQSQSTTSAASPTGQRYIQHHSMGYTPLLFVREQRTAAGGQTAPYAFLGPATYVSHTGSAPMSIIWQLDHAMPARLARTARQAISA